MRVAGHHCGRVGLIARPKKDPTAWRYTPYCELVYRMAKAEAQFKANASGRDFGIEFNDLMKTCLVFGLPQKRNRCGHELRCEVVMSELQNHQPGHGSRSGET